MILAKKRYVSYITPLQDRILEVLSKHGDCIRKDLVKIINHPRTTIYDNLLKLQKRKLIEKYTMNNGKRGRPIVYWKLIENPEVAT